MICCRPGCENNIPADRLRFKQTIYCSAKCCAMMSARQRTERKGRKRWPKFEPARELSSAQAAYVAWFEQHLQSNEGIDTALDILRRIGLGQEQHRRQTKRAGGPDGPV